MFCRSLFVLLYFFIWPLCCMFFFDIRILITPLVSSNAQILDIVIQFKRVCISPSSTLIKQYQVCLCNTSHVYILINLFDLCQHFFLHCYIHFFKCWHMLNEPFILSIIFDWSMISTDRKQIKKHNTVNKKDETL
jgi:hypothetical protein